MSTHTEDAPTPDEADAGAVDRRTALKAAMGGAAVAGAWTAPRIEGLSLAPDYAAAASCAANSAITQISKNSNNCGLLGDTECFGGNCCNSVAMGSGTADGRFNINANIGGNVNGGGNVNFTVGGIDPPFQRCIVNVSGNCNNDGSWSGGGTYTFNNNGNVSSAIDCQGGGNLTEDDPNATVRVNMTCQCSNTPF